MERSARAALVASVTAVCGGVAASSVAAASFDRAAASRSAAPHTLVTARVNPTERGRPIAQSFLGVSSDWNRVDVNTGAAATGPNDIYDHLMGNLSAYGGGVPTLRIGGNFQDSAWWDPSDVVTLADDRRGLYTPITAGTLSALALNARTTGQRMILGLNLGADDPRLIQTEVRAFLRYVPRRKILALTIGNEPGQYPFHQKFAGSRGGRHVVTYLRSHSWNGNQYIGQWRRMATAIRSVARGLPLGGTDNFPGLVTAAGFIARTDRQLRVYTQHYYAETACTQTGHPYPPGSPHYPTLHGLLTGSQTFSLTPDIDGERAARKYHKPFYLDEFNSTSCGGRNRYSNSFGASLWLLDQYFANALIGVQGVDLHVDNPLEAPFGFGYRNGQWFGAVTPLYYAMLGFARAVGAHGRLLLHPTFTARSPERANVHVYGVRDADGSLRLIVIDKDLRSGGLVRLLVPHSRRPGTLVRLTGPRPSAITGVELGGQSVAADGALTGARRASTVKPAKGVYRFSLAAASAAILTIPGKPH
jgi:hypothetical protein